MVMDVPEQMWSVSPKDADGWFTLRNRASGKFLTAAEQKNGLLQLTIQGIVF